MKFVVFIAVIATLVAGAALFGSSNQSATGSMANAADANAK